jgi:GDPmannose 4,6-dehydratase
VIATGKTTEVRDFVRKAFAYVGAELEFRGKGIEEKAFISKIDTGYSKLDLRMKELLNAQSSMLNGQCVLEVDPRYFRPTEVDLLLGDPSKAYTKLGWKTELTLDDLVTDMMQSDLKLMQRDQFLRQSGFNTMNYYE